MAIGTYISIITLNVNGSNAPNYTDWLNGYKNKTHICAVYKKPTSDLKNTYRLKVKGCENIFHANEKQKKAGVAILISDK